MPRPVETNTYVAVKAGITQRHRQVGDPVIEKGIAGRGIIIRYLVNTGYLAGSDIDFTMDRAGNFTELQTWIMNQYHPSWHAASDDEMPVGSSLHLRILPGIPVCDPACPEKWPARDFTDFQKMFEVWLATPYTLSGISNSQHFSLPGNRFIEY